MVVLSDIECSKGNDLINETSKKFLVAMKNIKAAGMDTEFLAIIDHHSALTELVKEYKEIISTNIDENKTANNLSDNILNIALLEKKLYENKEVVHELECEARDLQGKLGGYKGGSPEQFTKYYQIIDDVLSSTKKDLNARGVIADIIKKCDDIARKKSIIHPTERQARTIVKGKIRDLLNKHEAE